MTKFSYMGGADYPAETYKDTILDQSSIVVYYNFDFVQNPKTGRTKSAVVDLQIGKNYIKFTDHHRPAMDSVFEKLSHLKYWGWEEMSQLDPYMANVSFTKNIIISSSNREVTIQNFDGPGEMEYKMKAPGFQWKLGTEEKEILGYKVKKATLNYAGRDWEAWYSEEIPLHFGPYIFGGLPGLILEMYDTGDNFHFLANFMENRKERIYKRIEDRIKQTTREKYLKLEKNYYANPTAFSKAVIYDASTGEIIEPETTEYPYNPIELH